MLGGLAQLFSERELSEMMWKQRLAACCDLQFTASHKDARLQKQKPTISHLFPPVSSGNGQKGVLSTVSYLDSFVEERSSRRLHGIQRICIWAPGGRMDRADSPSLRDLVHFWAQRRRICKLQDPCKLASTPLSRDPNENPS